jgi:hypothetical protein
MGMFGDYSQPERSYDVPDPEWPAYVEACRAADLAERAYLAAVEAASIAYQRTYDYHEAERRRYLPPTCKRCGVETFRPWENPDPDRNWQVCDRHQCKATAVTGIRCHAPIKGNDVLCGTHRYRETERVLRSTA